MAKNIENINSSKLLQEYIQRQKKSQTYDNYVAQKVELGRQSIRVGIGMNNQDVERLFVVRRAKLAGKI